MIAILKRGRPLLLTAGFAAMAWTAACSGVAMAAPAGGAEAAWQDVDADVRAGRLEVPVNKSQMLTVDQPFGRVMIGNPEVADITPISSRSIYVLGGKEPGTTSLTIYDKADKVIAVIDVAVGPDVVSLRQQMAKLLPGEKIDAHISNDAIVLTGLASNAPAVDRAVQLARTYAGDKVVNMVSVGASQQVMLEVRFSEVRRDVAKNIGTGAFLSGKKFDGVFGNGAQLVPDADTGVGVMQRSAVTDTFGVFRKLFSIGSLNVEGTLDALEEKGLLKTLAQPTLIALSGETASFLAGGEFPIPVVQSGNTTGNASQVTVEFKPFGVSLAFTPTVLADGVISLSVEPEVSALDENASVQINGLNIPGLRTRRASTVLELRDGEAFAIAGLLQSDFATKVRQLPLLGSIPILGSLFRSSGFQRGETELVIVVIPRLVKPTRPENVSLPTDRVGDASEGDLFLMGRTDKAVPVLPDAKNRNRPSPAAQPGAQPAPEAKGKGADGYEY